MAEEKHDWRGFAATASVLVPVWAGQKCINMCIRVLFKQAFLDGRVKKFKSLRSPKASGNWGLVGNHADEVALFSEGCDRLCGTAEEFNFLWTIDIAGFPKVQHAVSVKKSDGGICTCRIRQERRCLHERAVHGSWLA